MPSGTIAPAPTIDPVQPELMLRQPAALLAGSLTTALAIRNGLVVGGATGGFQGTGTVNGAGFYRNGAALPVPIVTRPACTVVPPV